MYELFRIPAKGPFEWEPWPLNFSEGTSSATRVHYLRKEGSHGNSLSAGIFECEEPCVVDATIREDETLYVLAGRAQLDFDDGQRLVADTGDVISMPKGAKCRWEIIDAPFRHFWVYAG